MRQERRTPALLIGSDSGWVSAVEPNTKTDPKQLNGGASLSTREQASQGDPKPLGVKSPAEYDGSADNGVASTHRSSTRAGFEPSSEAAPRESVAPW
jgi:hypothetical protein